MGQPQRDLFIYNGIQDIRRVRTSAIIALSCYRRNVPRNEQNFDVELNSSATADQLFSLLANAPGWPTWFRPTRRVRWLDGCPTGGAGSVRLVTMGPLTVQERVLAEDSPRHHAYSIETVLPIRDHRADVWFTPSETGTHIGWSTSFTPRVPGTGTMLRAAVEIGVRRLAAALITAAEALPRTS
jgi:hypothetical protein